MDNITQIISSVGFPIAMCLVLCWFIWQQTKAHREESDKIQDALNNLTQMVNKLAERIGMKE